MDSINTHNKLRYNESKNQILRIRTRISLNQLFAICFSFLSIFKSWTFVRQSGDYYEHLIADTIIVLCSLIAVLVFLKSRMWDPHGLKWCIFPITLIFVQALYRYDNTINWREAGISVIFIACCFLLINDLDKLRVYQALRVIFVIVSFLSIIFYASYSIHGFIPYRYVQYYAVQTQAHARYVDFAGIVLFTGPSGILRLCGVFNEPGLFGTFLGLLLLSDNIDIKKISNLILFIAGILTFSMAFLLLISGGCIIKYRKDWKLMLIFLLVFLSILIIPQITFTSSNLKYFFNRIINVTNNRESLAFEKDFHRVVTSDAKWLGIGNGYRSINTSSIKTYIVRIGYIGVLFYVGYIIKLGLYYSTKNIYSLSYIGLFTICMYQRPDVIAPVYFILLLGGLKNLNEINQ